MKMMIKILYYFVISCLLLLLLINSYLIVMRFAFADTLPKVFGYSHAIVVSGSMDPVLEVGDVVVFKEKDNYEINDIVIFNYDNTYITHRIVGFDSNGFITKGDANNVVDDTVLSQVDIEGAYVLRIQNIGSIFTFLGSPIGIIILVFIGIGMYEIPILLNSKRRVKNEN